MHTNNHFKTDSKTNNKIIVLPENLQKETKKKIKKEKERIKEGIIERYMERNISLSVRIVKIVNNKKLTKLKH